MQTIAHETHENHEKNTNRACFHTVVYCRTGR